MEEYYLGYIFSSEELQIIFSGLGMTEMYGLPVKTKDISADEEMLIIRQLLRKKILTWNEEDGYKLESRFRQAFDAVKMSSYSLSLISCNYPVNGYVCFPGEPVVIWEISGYMDERFTLLMFSMDRFAEMLINEEFIPRLSSYCGEFSDMLVSDTEEVIENAETSGDISSLKYPFIVKKNASGSQEYVIIESDVNGNHIIKLSDEEKICMPYDPQKVLDYIKMNLNGDGRT